ncbi:MAG: hypothetical protein K6E16_01125 [Lachnospiraceae bacterium]|nr:hypothetical protein [Lachnospiraceae bacterium]
MREIVASFFDIYTRYSGRGKLLPLFLAAVIILFLIGSRDKNRPHPFLFVLSVWTGIAYAFEKLFRCISSRAGKCLTVLLITVAVLLSGASVWSAKYLETGAMRRIRENDYQAVCDTILQADPHACVAAAPDMMPYFGAYSADFELLYPLPAPGQENKLTKEEHMLYDAFCDRHPDFMQVRRLGRDRGSFFAVVDKEAMWPEHIYESGFDLMTTVDHYDIYVCRGGAHE